METPKSTNAQRSAQPHEMAQKVALGASRMRPMEDGTPDEARALRNLKGNPFAPPACELADISDVHAKISSGGLRIRVYKPKALAPGLQPCLVFFHGGGYVLSNVEQYDTVTQQLAFHSGCVVCSVDYTLAPERKLTGIHADGYEAYKWIVENASSLGIDEQRIAVGGDSAGGNLAVAVVLACKREGFAMPAYQLLIYPSVDLAMSFPSIDEFAEGYFLTKTGMQWFRDHYLETPEQALDEELKFLAKDLSGLPPAYVMTAGFDPLRDEGHAFAQRLEEFGVKVEHECYTDMIHGFISFAGGIPAGLESLQSMGNKLKVALS
jgi:acetyl esterase